MPSNKSLRRQASQLTNAGLPSKRSIRRQYTRAEGDAGGFTSALVSLLKGEQGTAGQAYGSAISQQNQIDDAARQQLGGLGEGYGGGAAAKVGATGDSAISGLLQGQAAASDYASRQPGIAAGRGALAQEGLVNAMTDAMKQRQDSYRSGFAANYQQVQQNAQSRELAIANLGLSQQQLALSQRSEAFQEGQANRSYAEQVREFNIRQADARQTAAAAGLSPSEFRSEAALVQGIAGAPKATTSRVPVYSTRPDPNDPSKKIRVITGYREAPVQGQDTRDIVQKGTPYRAALQMVLDAGVQPQVAQLLLGGLYQKYAKAPTDSPAFRAYLSYYHMSNPDRISRAERRNQGLTGPH